MTTRVLLLFMLCAVMYQMCLAKPAKVLQNPESLSPVKHEEVISITDKREQRSPQFGLLGGDYGESDLDVERTFKQRRYRRPQECLEFPCGPIEPVPLGPLGPLRPPVPFGPPVPPVYPPPPLYPEQAGGSFATASAGSNVDGLPIGLPIGEQSEANAQSANFNLGPFSASFSNAGSSSDSEIF
ncbi:uncharacterized protein LOC122534755 isoform X2 [Frieseomelitta varia]|uniref:uncharacterized protein LOC122534755 isoform X2 n=1 Tax=Frieseomelitta varia TaxID=561572 RepID=UPI001CB699BB|nr:uncharacterized protein LOC122534755 isoform X2 [Frieseomelitta varia]